MNCSTPGFPALHHLPEFAQTYVHQSVMPSNHLILCCPLLFPPSQHQGLFKLVSSLHQVAKVLEFQLQHQSFQWTFGLISFRIDWFDLLVVQGPLKSLLQHHSSKASILWPSDFFTVQLSHLYVTMGKIIALTMWTCVSKVMFLLFKLLIFINFLLLIFASSFMKYHYKLMDFKYT